MYWGVGFPGRELETYWVARISPKGSTINGGNLMIGG